MTIGKVTTLEKFNSSITQVNYSKTSLRRIGTTLAEIQGVYPFKIRFQVLGYPGYSPGNPPAIGIAIVGSTFYIL